MLRLSALPVLVVLALAPTDARASEPLIHTYSIVARDPQTGLLGVAVQSHWLQVGTMVPWAEPGIGAIATQALTNVSYGPRGLELLRQDKSAPEVLEALLQSDPEREHRQLAVVDRQGRTAAFTGSLCLPAAGHHQGTGYVVQANLMRSNAIWPAMARAYERSQAPFAERLLAALRAAQEAGGDLRGAQSAALLVVGSDTVQLAHEGRPIDLRVADHPHPVAELERLLELRRAYDTFSAADAALRRGDKQRATELFARARRLAPKREELRFWYGVALAETGDPGDAALLLRPLLGPHSTWRTLLERLPAGDILSAAQVAAILKAATTASP